MAIRGRILIIFFFLLLVGSIAAAGYFFFELKNLKNNPNAYAESENKALVSALGQIILLPENEQPTIATVTDPKELADQAFFANAKVGYKVFVYTKAKKAILYDPVKHMIVEVGPVNITDGAEGGGVSQPESN
jgi:hypothetical protein